MLKFFGSFNLASGSLSEGVAIGGGTIGAMFATPSLSGRPCAHGGGVAGDCAAADCAGAAAGAAGATAGAGFVGACCAAIGHGTRRPPTIAGSNIFRERDETVFMAISSCATLWSEIRRNIGVWRSGCADMASQSK